jgi:hypothetical protein
LATAGVSKTGCDAGAFSVPSEGAATDALLVTTWSAIGRVEGKRDGEPGLVTACQAARTILERFAVVEREMIEFSMLLKIFALHRIVFACFCLT